MFFAFHFDFFSSSSSLLNRGIFQFFCFFLCVDSDNFPQVHDYGVRKTKANGNEFSFSTVKKISAFSSTNYFNEHFAKLTIDRWKKQIVWKEWNDCKHGKIHPRSPERRSKYCNSSWFNFFVYSSSFWHIDTWLRCYV